MTAPDALELACATFRDDYPHAVARWSTQTGAQHQCRAAAALFVGYLDNEYGIAAETVTGWATFEEIGGQVDVGHAAVAVGDVVIDWTARQFYPGAPVPLICDYQAWRTGWGLLRDAPTERLRRYAQ